MTTKREYRFEEALAWIDKGMGRTHSGLRQTPADIEPFCRAVFDARCESFLEIGTMWGGSFVLIGMCCEPGATLWTMDPRDPKDHLNARCYLASHGYDVRVLHGASTDPNICFVAPPEIDVLFYDGSRTLEEMQDALNDFRARKLVGVGHIQVLGSHFMRLAPKEERFVRSSGLGCGWWHV